MAAKLLSIVVMRRSLGSSGNQLVFRSDFEKHVVIANLERRGMQRAKTEEDEWHFYWASVHSVRQIFNPETGQRLGEHQIINHFPNHYELTRKDLMVKNIKRYRKERDKQEFLESGGDRGERAMTQEKLAAELTSTVDFVPTTFALPADYALFVEEFRRNPNASWIMKPTGKAQGKGIFLVSKLTQLKKWASTNQKTPFQPMPFREPYIISRYIDNPFLVGGKKFDMRLYVLVTSYRPLKAYLYNEGFCRFCNEQYTTDVAEFDNVFIHLTNVAVQKQSDDYNDNHGGKWKISDLKLYVESIRGHATCVKLFKDMDNLIITSLKAVQAVMINDKHCFELYGFDILLDKNLHSWLLEVNASPSLSTTTEEDRILKLRLLNDVFSIVVAPNFGQETGGGVKSSTSWCSEDVVGGFTCLIDEGKLKQREEQRKAAAEAKKGANERRMRSSSIPAKSGGWR